MSIDGIAGAVGLALVAPIAISALVAVLRGPRVVSAMRLLIGALITTATTALYWALMPVPLETVPLAIAAGLGALAGVVGGVAVSLTGSAQGPVGRAARMQVPYLLSLAAVQGAAALGSTVWLVLAQLAMVLTATLAVAGSIVLAGRAFDLRPRPAARTGLVSASVGA